MALSEKDKAFILQQHKKLSARRLAKELGQPRPVIEKFIASLSSSAPSTQTAPGPASRGLPVPGWACAAVLLAQNLLLFWRHYFADSGFAYDFESAGHAVPFYWITSVQEGLFPAWVAQEAMGYPFFLCLATGFFYPPLWLFVLLGHTFTLHAAVVFQCLHFALGGAGMFVFCRARRLPAAYALLAAAGYQFFGGFFCNAQHDTIVRGYALVPWLLAGLTTDERGGLGLRALVLTPLSFFLLFTGGYPGIGLASLFMGALYAAFQAKALVRQGLLFALGLALAAVQLVPAGLFKSELSRAGSFTTQVLNTFTPAHFFTLFTYAHTDALSLNPSMRSIFITMPFFVCLFFLSRRLLRLHLPAALLAAAAALMITGSPLYGLVTTILPPLKFSRFPASDYRAFVAVPLLLLAAEGLRELLSGPSLPRVWFAARLFAAGALIAFGFFRLGVRPLEHPAVLASIVLTAAFFIAAALPFLRGRPLEVFFLAVLLASGWAEVNSDRELWEMPAITADLKGWFDSISDSSGAKYDFDRQIRGAAALRAALKNPPAERPRRRVPLTPYTMPEEEFAWRGYLTGDFMLNDYSMGMQLRRQQELFKDSALRPFMEEKSAALVLPADAPLDLSAVRRAVVERTGLDRGSFSVKSYASNEIVYDVRLDRPATVVENETYFPGWTGNLPGSAGTAALAAVPAAEGLRAWRLPAGTYEFRTRFRMPWLRTAAAISCAALLVWLSCLALALAGRAKTKDLPRTA
ncbi:MAG TPA: hypothetical protein VL404_00370 [Candidatus Eisenbacteria bacterium]|nr:hypothetical protein [Candidatus Eisenbacteria bacterium]